MIFFLLLKFFNRDMTELWCGRMDHESLGVWEILDRAVIMTPHKKHKKKEKEEEGSCGQKLIVGHATLYMSDRMKHIFSIWFFNFTWKKKLIKKVFLSILGQILCRYLFIFFVSQNVSSNCIQKLVSLKLSPYRHSL